MDYTNYCISEIKKARFFTVLADKIADISNTKQMSIVLRYVDNECNIKEDFIQFTSCRICNSTMMLLIYLQGCTLDEWLSRIFFMIMLKLHNAQLTLTIFSIYIVCL